MTEHGTKNGAMVRIALPEPTSTDHAYNQRAWAPYFHALTSCGAVGVPIPLDSSPAMVAKLAASCSGVLLPGSPADLNPQKYGETALQECAPADTAREAVDELLLQDAFNLHKPLLGICYGAQALNVWLGGTLVQHLPLITAANHDAGPSVLAAHSLQLAAGSRLAALVRDGEDQSFERPVLDGESTVVNSSHHQAIDRPGDGLLVTAHSSEDGVLEAVEGVSDTHFILGVQWHPERSFDASGLSRHLFRAFVEAAALYQPRKVVESLA